MKITTLRSNAILNSTVIVSALGYFVDIYDLLLFGIVRVASLRDLNLPEDKILETGILLINLQMFGMLVGGILWGIIGDKKGRVSVLFGSILIYSLANIANSFIHSVTAYGILRFFAGVGLAGELGAAITLVSETLPKECRGFGNAIVASVGILGAVFAGIVGDTFHWRTSYLMGGILGCTLLVMRLSLYESGMFEKLQKTAVKKGDFRMLFSPWSRFRKYAACILVGVPIWFVIGLPVTFSPELGKSLHIVEPISAGRAILFAYLGGAIGNFFCGLLSQYWKSRRKVIFSALMAILAFLTVLLSSKGLTVSEFYFLCGILGFATGYWVVFMTHTAEQFGTNLRATATTTVPNFVRASVVILTFSFQFLKSLYGTITALWIVGLFTLALALLALFQMKDTFHADLNFVENQ